MNDVVDGWHWLTSSENWWGPGGLVARLGEHLWYSLLATGAAVLIGLPIGLAIGHTGRGRFAAASTSNVLRAVPTLGVVTLLFTWRPLTLWPVLVALTVLAIPPVLINAAAGVSSVDPQVRDAARGLGMSRLQVLRRVEIPNALPLILAGVRSSANQVIATATVAGFKGLGGFGVYIYSGFGTQHLEIVYGATIAVVALVFAVEGLFAVAQRLAVSPGIRVGTRRRTAVVSTPPLG